MEQNDRVSYSFGMKLSLPAKYESADFHVSMSSDVSEGETLKQAFDRVKLEVTARANTLYEQIRTSESGLSNEQQSRNQENETVPRETKTSIEASPGTSKGTKVLKQQIKLAFGVLEAQKKITKDDFKTEYLNNKRTDELSELEVTKAIVLLRENFPELKL